MDDTTDTDSEPGRTKVIDGAPHRRRFLKPRNQDISSDEDNPIPSIETDDDDDDEDMEEDQNDDDEVEGRMGELPSFPRTQVEEDRDRLLMPPPPRIKVEDMDELLLPPERNEAIMTGLQPPREANEEILKEIIVAWPPLPERNDEDMPDLPPPPRAQEEEEENEEAPVDDPDSPLSSVSSKPTPPWIKYEEIIADLPPLPEHDDEDMPDLPPPPNAHAQEEEPDNELSRYYLRPRRSRRSLG